VFFIRLFALLGMVLLLAACQRDPAPIELSGPTMGTLYSVRVARPPANVEAHTLRALIDDELAKIDLAMSGYRPDSEISRFNASTSTEWFDVSPELAHVVAAALEVSEQSGGAFDVTVAPLVKLWGFGPAKGEVIELPAPEAVAAQRSLLGYTKLHVRTEPAALRKDEPSLTVDLNGIAPGFAVDRIARRFEELAIVNYMIDIGGEVRVRGTNTSRQPWRIAIEHPLDTSAQPYAVLALSDVSVTTSGEYRQFFTRDDRRYSHTIDPRTGEPVAHTLASVVVVHPQAMFADAWATAFNVLGAEEGHPLAKRLGIDVLFLTQQNGRIQERSGAGFDRWRATGRILH
jgi:thiamine biosynthesis lipoprotein